MEKKVVIVTGGSSGMGKAIAKKQAELGWSVMLTGRTLDALEETKKEIENSGGKAAFFQMDVRSESAAKEMITGTVETFGRLDALINNAAGNFICPAEKLTPNGWR
ncbi:SDR family NAD(P)-dependent oxidoreductase, partial [Bacillus atrophaeus]